MSFNFIVSFFTFLLRYYVEQIKNWKLIFITTSFLVLVKELKTLTWLIIKLPCPNNSFGWFGPKKAWSRLCNTYLTTKNSLLINKNWYQMHLEPYWSILERYVVILLWNEDCQTVKRRPADRINFIPFLTVMLGFPRVFKMSVWFF